MLFFKPDSQLTITEELRLDPKGVHGRELREELALNSSELIFSEHSPSPSLRPLLMELLSSQLKQKVTPFIKSVLITEWWQCDYNKWNIVEICLKEEKPGSQQIHLHTVSFP